jgi:DNA-binding FadR family transcriptional regulator
MTSLETMDKVSKELKVLAANHGVCIAAVVTAAKVAEGQTVMANPQASHPLALLKATMALEDQAARFVAENATEAFEALMKEAETTASGTFLTRKGWRESD